jgi:transposase
MNVEPHHDIESLEALTREQEGRRAWERHRAVVLAEQGRTAGEIAEAPDCGARTAQARVARYNAGGAEAPAERPRPGRPTTLPRDQEGQLRARLDAPPLPGDGTCALHGPDVRRILEAEFAALYTLRGVYDLLHRLGYSGLMPRPRHKGSDPGAQEASKKGPPRGSPPPPRPTRTSGPRSGTRTRPGSAGRGR